MCNFKYGDIVKVDDESHNGFFNGKIGYFIRIMHRIPRKQKLYFLEKKMSLKNMEMSIASHYNI